MDNKENTVPETESCETCETSEETQKKSCKKKKDKNDEAAKKLIAELLEENEKLKAELSSQKDAQLRLMAEYDNFRKRTASEKSQIYTDSTADAVEKFLPVIDNLERAATCEAQTDEGKAIKAGVELVLRSFAETLEKMGVSEIPALGEKFDPNMHNAVMQEDDPDKSESEITEVFQKGYKIGNKVIRYSMVKVAN